MKRIVLALVSDWSEQRSNNYDAKHLSVSQEHLLAQRRHLMYLLNVLMQFCP